MVCTINPLPWRYASTTVGVGNRGGGGGGGGSGYFHD